MRTRALWIMTTMVVLLVACGISAGQAPAAAEEMKAPRVRPELLERWEKMTPEEREKMRERMDKWRAMTPEERERVLKNMERFRKMSPEQRTRLIETRRKWDRVPPEARRKMRRQFDQFRELPPEKRAEIMQQMAAVRKLLKGDFEAMKQAPEEGRETLAREVHRKVRALMMMKKEDLEAFQKLSAEEQAAKLKEVVEQLPAEEMPEHGPHKPHRRGEEGRPGPPGEEIRPTPLPEA